MASSDYSGLRCGNSVSEVLKMANTELQDLRAHYRTVTQRIRRLRIVVDALGELGLKGAGFEVEQKEPSLDRSLNGLSGTPSPSRDSLLERSKSQTAWNRAKRIHSRSPDLRRACRIALLETFDAVSREEVYERIVRRGSFCFADTRIAAPSILEELNALTEHGELRRVEGPSGVLWQRVPLATEPADPVFS